MGDIFNNPNRKKRYNTNQVLIPLGGIVRMEPKSD